MSTTGPALRVRILAAKFLLCAAVLSVCMILLGLLLTRVVEHTWPISAEDGVDRFLAVHRVGWANTVTDVLCDIANTVGAAVVTLIAVLWAGRRRHWAEAVFLAFSVLLELVVFLVTTVVVHRARPSVLELDTSPPTSSYPSGHTAAALALYGAVAVIVYRRTGRKVSWLLLLMPAAVGLARLYRGMHHPSDVAAGLLLGALCIWLAHRCVLRGRVSQTADEPTASPPPLPVSASTPDVLIVNGSKADDDMIRQLTENYGALCAETGRPAPHVVTTTPEDHGAGAAAAAVQAGAGLVVACGGDGTINEVAGALAGTDTVLGIVPLGTGNLLAGNLGIPDKLEEALTVLVEGTDRRIDVGRLSGRGGDRIFLGMAGMGLDAAMVDDAPEGLKRRAGWAAYGVAVARHLADRIAAVTVDIDGRRTRHRDVSMVLIGNIGRLQAGFQPLPDAEIDDGLLDVALVCPHGTFGWLRVVAALRGGRNGETSRVVHWDQGRRITISSRHPVTCEADGEVIEPAAHMDVEVWPGALRVRVAPAAGGEAVSR